MPEPLAPRQKDVLLFITDYQQRYECAPTVREPQSAFLIKQQRLAEVAERGRLNAVVNRPAVRQAPHQP